MSTEHNHISPAEDLTRRQKLLRRGVPALLLTAGVVVGGGMAAHETSKDGVHETHTVAGATGNGVAEFGDSKSGWEHGAAKRALRGALTEAVTEIYTSTEIGQEILGNGSLEETVDETVDDMLTYDGPTKVLEIAKKGTQYTIPGVGDSLTTRANVEVNSEDEFSYDVLGATIEDSVNN